MIKIEIPQTDLWDQKNEEFISVAKTTLKLEHSLISLHKWESKWHKPFLDKTRNKSLEEQLDYVKCMTINEVDKNVYGCLNQKQLDEIDEYINEPMTATTIYSRHSSNNSDPITAEIIYYWMISLHIPKEFEKWHLNQLFTLIKVCSIKNAPKEEQNQAEIISEFEKINSERQKQFKKG